MSGVALLDTALSGVWRRTQVTPRDYEREGKPKPSASAERDATALEGAVPPGFIRTAIVRAPMRLFRQVDEAVLDHRHLGMQLLILSSSG
jgi:hypothetical protein